MRPTDQEIDKQARELLAEMLERQEQLWPDGLPRGLLEMIDPEVAAGMLGLSIHYFEELGGTERTDVAAILDRQAGRIYVSRHFPPEVMRFTLAHELGHVVLHRNLTGLHRDRPVRGLMGPRSARPQTEVEADRFAASFLMPRKLVTEAFKKMYGQLPFVFDDSVSFVLSPDDPDLLMRPDEGSYARGFALATARSWKGKHYIPLHQLFRVSGTSMAIRLEELGLIQEG